MRKGTAHASCDAGSTGTVVDGRVDGLVVEEGVAGLRDAREESRVGVETGVEEQGRRGAERAREAGLERRVSMVMDEEAGAA